MTIKPNKQFCVFFLLFCFAGFFVAASKGASMSAAVEALAFAIAVALVIGGAYAILHWFHPKKLLEVSSFAQAQEKERGGWFAGILTLLVAFAVSNWAFALLEYLVICHLYGHAAWVSGLRVVGRHGNGELTNGDVLPSWPSLMLYMGTVATTVIFGIGSFLLFRYIGFRLRGRQWSDHVA